MYSRVCNLKSLIPIAENFVEKNDRAFYVPYYAVIEEYASKNNILVGGNISIDMLGGDPQSIHHNVYLLYTYDAYTHAMNLIRELYNVAPKFSDITHDYFAGSDLTDVMVKYGASEPVPREFCDKFITSVEKDHTIDAKFQTVIMYKEFNIYVNSRQIALIRQFEKSKNVLLQNVLPHVKVKGFSCNVGGIASSGNVSSAPGESKCSLNILQPELQIIEVYRRLYLPYAENTRGYPKYTEWLELEDFLFKKLNLSEAVRGKYNQRNPVINQDKYEKMDTRIIKECIVDENIFGENTIIVGDYAIEYLLGTEKAKAAGLINTGMKSRLQIVTDVSVEAICAMFEEKFKSRFTANQHRTDQPDDFQLKKHTIMVMNERQSMIPVMDVFNSTDYEVLPYKMHHINEDEQKNGKHIKLGGIFVLIRFKFIDIWTLQVFSVLNQNANIKNVIEDLSLQINYLRKIAYSLLNKDTLEVFQQKDYAGKYINESVIKKRMKDKFTLDRFHIREEIDKAYKKSTGKTTETLF